MTSLDRLRALLSDRYAMERELGRGGMAIVYLARDLRHDRFVAVKVLRPEIATAVGSERFLREIHIAAQLQHPLILPLHDSGVADGALYCVMPYVEGESLRDRLRREGPLPLAEAVRIARDVADALSYAHARGFVHRDVKPENILLSGGHALLADFGIARALESVGPEALTTSGLVVGTPAYMSPEQAGGGRVDGRADIYSLGCVTWEMLAGEPPFTGPSVQAVMARHMQEPLPSLPVVRPTVPPGLQHAVVTALAKVPADRFSTAAAFAEALEATPPRMPLAWLGGWRAALLAGLGIVAAGAVAADRWLRPRVDTLDQDKVVVFPLVERGGSEQDRGIGETTALLIGSTLERTEPLAWVYGWTWLREEERVDVSRLVVTDAQRIAREQGAAFFLDGWVVFRPESLTVILRLQSVAGDSIVRSAAESSARSRGSAYELTLRALNRLVVLLPALAESGVGEATVRLFADRSPAAVISWMQGEREYRHARFERALEYFERAVLEDSGLAEAALKGAMTANWVPEGGPKALPLARAAVRRGGGLPPKYREFARGLLAYHEGQADTAVAAAQASLQLDPGWAEAWALLGEAYQHLLPVGAIERIAGETMPPRASVKIDSLADDAFRAVQRVDPDFAPVLVHLTEHALRRQEVPEAERLFERYTMRDPDETTALQLEVMLRCVRDGPGTLDWQQLAARNPRALLWAGKELSVGAAQAACAEAAFAAVLGAAEANTAQEWDALVGLQSLLVAQERGEELRRLLDSAAAAGMQATVGLYVFDLLTGAPTGDSAARVIERFGTDYQARASPTLWLIGSWHAYRGDARALVPIAGTLDARATATQDRLDRLLANALRAHLSLLRGDTARAVTALRALQPNAPRGALSWRLWEPLAWERMLLAKLLLARGDAREAHRVAEVFDGHPVAYVAFVRQSLELRLEAARQLGDRRLVDDHQRRLARLTRANGISDRP